MMSSNGNIFRVTGQLCWEFTLHRWIPRTKASNAELWCFFNCTWMNGWVNNLGTGDLRRHRSHHDVTVMVYLSGGVGMPIITMALTFLPYLIYRWIRPPSVPSFQAYVHLSVPKDIMTLNSFRLSISPKYGKVMHSFVTKMVMNAIFHGTLQFLMIGLMCQV